MCCRYKCTNADLTPGKETCKDKDGSTYQGVLKRTEAVIGMNPPDYRTQHQASPSQLGSCVCPCRTDRAGLGGSWQPCPWDAGLCHR